MKLPVIKPRTYISPSAFKIYRTCQNQFYHFYLAGHAYIERETNRAAGIGTIFDAHLKAHLNKLLGINDPRLEFENLTRFITWAEDVDVPEVYEIAGEVAFGYIKNKFHSRFLKAKDIVLDREMYGLIHTIPILGILDANLDSIPFDWKLRGFNSKTSPTKGYQKRWDSHGNIMKPHKDSGFPCNLEAGNVDFALQMLWYNWLNQYQNRIPKEKKDYIIHEICWDSRDWNLTEHTGQISNEFEQEILKELTAMWNNINRMDCDIEKPTPTIWKCEKFNTVCPSAAHCSEYQRTLGDPERRVLFT